MGVKKAIELIEEIKGVDAIFITKNKEIYVTDGVIVAVPSYSFMPSGIYRIFTDRHLAY
jgi:thiamine biosynthesis lipoprotein ApbE